MLPYILRRILLALPTLLIISLITFGLSKCATGDPVREVYRDNSPPTLDPEAQAAAYQRLAITLGQDKPVFYFSLTTGIFPDTLYRIFPPERRKRLRALTARSGDWPSVSRYEQQLAEAIRAVEKLPDSLPQKSRGLLALSNFFSIQETDHLTPALDSLKAFENVAQGFSPALTQQLADFQATARVLSNKDYGSYFPTPALHWYGADNQYHHWISGLLQGDFGISYTNRLAVGPQLYPYVLPTLVLNGLALLLAYLLAVPLGVNMARRQRQSFDTWTRRTLLFLYALPVFWLGSLMILAFATPGMGLHLINGISPDSPWQGSRFSFFQWCAINAPKFILPVLTLAIHALALLAMQMRGGMLDIVGQDFIRTARAKGVPEDLVYWRHAFRNALFPLITVFASVFPALFAGSLVVEYLFNFPGMGIKTQEAFIRRDYPVLFAIMMIAAALTIMGNLIADVLFAWADPRVRFSKGKG